MNPSIFKHCSVTTLTISAQQAGQRIDNFLLTHLKGVPRSHIYRILRTGEVRINKGRAKPTYRLNGGDVLRLPPVQCALRQNWPGAANLGKKLENTILYEDTHLLIINKPAGIAVHGGSGINGGVIEGLRALYPNAPYLELVHRLDRETSGCLIIAKKRSMLRRLHELLRHAGLIKKQYFALVQGRWNPRITHCNAPLKKNSLQSGERVVRVSANGKPAISQFSIVKQFATTTLLRVQLLTGRTHQIRVHLAHLGHPIAGDSKYGDDTFNQQQRHLTLKRLFLHAEKLDINLPELGYRVTTHAPLPAPLQQVLDHLGNWE
ncbi:MAG TPA: 23S rRNA pseudouridine(955/2504/2580) synthase RluC [Thioploca sp.]|nr:MAG: 23S rRNA pseudouridine(955/2504/2580) synthase RluC [Gammaproteobacteria bacterium]HDN27154.1 23S rRNA pseudouridine(955/2504/2580) synthase RluC [Thioploca sp.]